MSKDIKLEEVTVTIRVDAEKLAQIRANNPEFIERLQVGALDAFHAEWREVEEAEDLAEVEVGSREWHERRELDAGEDGSMTEHNHRRGTKRKRAPNGIPKPENMRNGYTPRNGHSWGYIDHSLHGWGNASEFSDRQIGAGIGNDFTNGHRGEARAVKGAKKFVRSRTRFHENATTRTIIRRGEDEE